MAEKWHTAGTTGRKRRRLTRHITRSQPSWLPTGVSIQKRYIDSFAVPSGTALVHPGLCVTRLTWSSCCSQMRYASKRLCTTGRSTPRHCYAKPLSRLGASMGKRCQPSSVSRRAPSGPPLKIGDGRRQSYWIFCPIRSDVSVMRGCCCGTWQWSHTSCQSHLCRIPAQSGHCSAETRHSRQTGTSTMNLGTSVGERRVVGCC